MMLDHATMLEIELHEDNLSVIHEAHRGGVQEYNEEKFLLCCHFGVRAPRDMCEMLASNAQAKINSWSRFACET